MSEADRLTFNTYATILDKVNQMLGKLDQYRAEKNEADKKKKLFAVRSIETEVRHMIKNEKERQRINRQKKAA